MEEFSPETLLAECGVEVDTGFIWLEDDSGKRFGEDFKDKLEGTSCNGGKLMEFSFASFVFVCFH